MKYLLVPIFVVVAALLTVGQPAHAFPAYSQKEKKPCLYCHVNPSGGGKRNAAGIWYKKHALSFAGYTPEKAAAEAGISATPSKPAAKPTPKLKASPAKKPAVKKPAPKKPAPKPTPKKP